MAGLPEVMARTKEELGFKTVALPVPLMYETDVS